MGSWASTRRRAFSSNLDEHAAPCDVSQLTPVRAASPSSSSTNVEHAGLYKQLLEVCQAGDAAKLQTLLVDLQADPQQQQQQQQQQIDLKQLVNTVDEGGDTLLIATSRCGHSQLIALLIDAGANVDGATANGATALYFAAQDGHADAVAELLAHDANVDAATLDGLTALLSAIVYGHKDIAMALLAAHARVDTVAECGLTALHIAATRGYADLVVPLIASHAHVDAVAEDGMSALHIASANGHADVVTALLAQHASVDAVNANGLTALLIASVSGHADVVTVLLTNGASVEKAEANGVTPLYIASASGHVGIVVELLAHHATVNVAVADGTTPLFIAAAGCHVTIITELLKHGANTEAVDAQGWTVLRRAARFNTVAVITTLLAHNARVDATDENGATALHFATGNGHGDAVAALLAHGANVNAVKDGGWTPLYLTAEVGLTAIALQLLDAHAHVDAVDATGATALYAAAAKGHKDLVLELLARHASVDATTVTGATPLLIAAQFGHVDVVSELLAHGASIAAVTAGGSTALHLATSNDHVDVVVELLKHNPNVEAVEADGSTALYEAALRGDTAIVTALLAHDAAVDAREATGSTPLYVAAQNGHSNVVRTLLDHHASVDAVDNDGWTALHAAAKNGHADVVQQLLDHHASVDAANAGGWTALHVAAHEDHVDVLTVLLAHHARVDAAIASGKAALHVAAQNGHTNAVMTLLANGADVHAVDTGGSTALHITAQTGHADVIALLLAHGVRVDAVESKGWTALHVAAQNGDVGVVRALLAHGVTVDAADDHGATPLHIAAQNDHTAVVAALLEHGASVDAAYERGSTALCIAAHLGHVGVVTELLNHSANVHATTAGGESALHFAALSGHKAVVVALLDHDASVYAIGVNRWTPLHAASASGHTDIVEELLARGAPLTAGTASGSTAVHLAAEHGHAEVVRVMLRAIAAELQVASTSGAEPSLWTSVLLELPDHRGDTVLLAAARACHFDIASLTVDAGVSVHARAADGETLLTLAVLFGNQRFIVELFERGLVMPAQASASADSSVEASVDRKSLMSSTLQTLTEAAKQMHEFTAMWHSVIDRLCRLFRQLATARAEASSHDSALQFVMLVCHFIRLQSVCSSSSVFARLAASQTAVNRLRDLHTELAFLERAVSVVVDGGSAEPSAAAAPEQERGWETQFASDEVALLANFRDTIVTLVDCGDVPRPTLSDADRAAVPLLQHKVTAHGTSCSPELLALLETCLDIADDDDATDTSRSSPPTWFIPDHDLDVTANDAAATSSTATLPATVHAKWSNSAVVASLHYVSRETFVVSVETCISLSHPNVVTVFGASHLHVPFVAVFETAASTSLREFLKDTAHTPVVWHRLLEVARGLRYLADRGVLLATLRCDDIWVGADGLAKVNAFNCILPDSDANDAEAATDSNAAKTAAAKARRVRWRAPECIRGDAPTAASTVYAFGMCVLEALTGERPWRDELDDATVKSNTLYNHRPAIPLGVADAPRRLVEQMWLMNPSMRPTLSVVCHALEQLAAAEMQTRREQQRSGSEQQPQYRPVANANVSLDTLVVPALEATVPAFLERLKRKCKLCGEHRDAIAYILERASNVVALLQTQTQQQRTCASDVALAGLSDVLLRLDRFLRFAMGATSVLQCAKSQRAALRSNVFHQQLDELLASLGTSEVDLVLHDWKRRAYEDSEHASSCNAIDDGDDATADAVTTAVRVPVPTKPEAVAITRFANDRLADAFCELDFGAADAVADAIAVGQTHTAAYAQSVAKLPWLVHAHELQYSSSDLIGTGAFGEVYRATWCSTPVVIKFMGYEADVSALDRALFFHELRVWFPLSHPHVAKLYGACHVGKRFFACELVGGGTLDAYLKKQQRSLSDRDSVATDSSVGPTTAATAPVPAVTWHLLFQIALGLQHLHDHNVLHNDLKCDNVLIDDGGNAKLIDFGLSSILDSAEVHVAPKRMGAIQWKSPEYLRGTERLTLASDVYALAMLMIEAVTGAFPWGAKMDVMVKFQVKKGLLPPRPARLTAAQWTLIEMMCAFDPTQRVTIAFVVDKLREFAAQSLVQAKGPIEAEDAAVVEAAAST